MFSLSVMESLCKVVLGAQQKAPNLNALNALNATFKSTFCLSKWFLGQYLCKRPQKSVSCYWQICSGSIFKVLSLKIFWWGILKCMMMMIGQMMKLRKQERSIWQRGALEWWSGQVHCQLMDIGPTPSCQISNRFHLTNFRSNFFDQHCLLRFLS